MGKARGQGEQADEEAVLVGSHGRKAVTFPRDSRAGLQALNRKVTATTV